MEVEACINTNLLSIYYKGFFVKMLAIVHVDKQATFTASEEK